MVLRKGRRADEKHMNTTTCCGRPPRVISIELKESRITFTHCEGCEHQSWAQAGNASTLSAIKESAALEWNRRRISA